MININKRFKEITFSCTVEEGQPKWFDELCPIIIEYMFFSEEIITRTPEIVKSTFLLPPYTEDKQITTEQTTNKINLFDDNTTFNFLIPINTANNRLKIINTQENGQVILKIGDTNSRSYNMGFRLNAVWSQEQKIALIHGYKYINPDVIIDSLEVKNLI